MEIVDYTNYAETPPKPSKGGLMLPTNFIHFGAINRLYENVISSQLKTKREGCPSLFVYSIQI
jgi:hypothetical protein